MKILITGGAGYKGAVLTRLLAAHNHAITLLDTFTFGSEAVLELVSKPNVSFVKKDVRSITRQDLKGMDVVIHLAGIVGFPACAAQPFDAQTINSDATRSISKLLDKEQVLIYASTTSVYGVSETTCDETDVVNPVSLYGKTKLEGELITLERENSVAYRIATVFGVSPRMRTTLLVNDFTYRAVKDRNIVIFDGHSKRPFIHISDVASAYLFAINNLTEMRGGLYNVGDDSLNFSKNEIAEAILAHTKAEIFKSAMPDPDRRDYNISFKKINKLGYKPVVSLDTGIKEMIKLYQFYTRKDEY